MRDKPAGPLRRGWTTGACATAATRAAYQALLTGSFPDPVSITLPKGQTPAFALATQHHDGDSALVGIIKDAGDDPDVTHLAMIQSRVSRGPCGSGITFKAGDGVGTVTLPGLPLGVGEPAINPVPRRLMTEVVTELSVEHGDRADVIIEISIPGGEELATRTWNPRLGILGGLSILGTTGVVVPYSCSAWIDSIHRGVDVARAMNSEHVAGCTGSTSEQVVQTHYGLADTQMLDMGDFVGGLLKYLRRHPVPRLSIGGGFAKISKLAQGHMDLHSGRSQVDLNWLAAAARELGGDADLCTRIKAANTASEALSHAQAAAIDLATYVARAAREQALSTLAGQTRIDVLVIDREGVIVGHCAD
ncbi:MAG: cobalt-precorrin-5B (C1)-methyltransferase [Gammaproteobacteria bacterium]|jgi:cobalt-precorrin-5B (C1)-methyltransferase